MTQKKNRSVVSIGNNNFIFFFLYVNFCFKLGFHLATWSLETIGDIVGYIVTSYNFYIGMTIGFLFIQVSTRDKQYINNICFVFLEFSYTSCLSDWSKEN